MKKIKILQIINGLGVGGAEKVVYDLCRYSLKTDVEMHLLAFGFRNDLLPEFVKEGINVDFFYVECNFNGFVKTLKHLSKKIKKEEYDLIHAHLFYPLLLALIVKCRNKYLPVCFTPHSTNLGTNRLSALCRHMVVFALRPFRNIDILFSRSQFRYIFKRNSIIIQNGIDTEKYNLKLQKNNIFTFINVARLEPVKNHFGLIEIVKKIRTSIPFQVLLAGDGSLREQIQEKITQNNLSDKIKILGTCYDIPVQCNKSHVFILPSVWEGMPLVLLEAGVCGLPVICTPVGSIPTIINDNNGYLATEDRFAETMEYVMANYNEAEEKASVLKKEVIKNYDISIMFENHNKVYQSLLKN